MEKEKPMKFELPPDDNKGGDGQSVFNEDEMQNSGNALARILAGEVKRGEKTREEASEQLQETEKYLKEANERMERTKRDGLSFEDFLFYRDRLKRENEQLPKYPYAEEEEKLNLYRRLLTSVTNPQVLSEIESYAKESEDKEVMPTILKIISTREEIIRKSVNPEDVLPEHFKESFPLVFEKINDPKKVLKFLALGNVFENYTGEILKIMNLESFARTAEQILRVRGQSDYIEFESTDYGSRHENWASLLSGGWQRFNELEEIKKMLFPDVKYGSKNGKVSFDWRNKE